jgi:hypothetical protein
MEFVVTEMLLKTKLNSLVENNKLDERKHPKEFPNKKKNLAS